MGQEMSELADRLESEIARWRGAVMHSKGAMSSGQVHITPGEMSNLLDAAEAALRAMEPSPELMERLRRCADPSAEYLNLGAARAVVDQLLRDLLAHLDNQHE